LFRLGAIWMVIGLLEGAFPHLAQWAELPPETVLLIGLAILTSGGAMTFAIYRCPVCDSYLSRFRPDKHQCAHCGVRVR
jgi:hypothetical protein